MGMDQRARMTPATTVAILQHYPDGNKAKVLSAFGHAHDQQCYGSRERGCDVILTGGGGGYIDHGSYLGFTAVHLTDDGGYEVVLESDEVRIPYHSCAWEEYFTTEEEKSSFLNASLAK